MSKLLPEFFRRDDEGPDSTFYAEPRFTTYLGPDASRAACTRYAELLPSNGHILDLMAGYVSHLPDTFSCVTGLGLNRDELSHNPRLDDYLVFDLNRPGFLPFFDETFDGVICTEGMPYLTRPLETFAEVARSLKRGAPFVVTFSNRMFATKAVLAWRAADDAARLRLVRAYFDGTPALTKTYSRHHEPAGDDPLYAVWAFKR
jgi:SAM-dependent methyltransferase